MEWGNSILIVFIFPDARQGRLHHGQISPCRATSNLDFISQTDRQTENSKDSVVNSQMMGRGKVKRGELNCG